VSDTVFMASPLTFDPSVPRLPISGLWFR
jgi:hypothetical protein